MTAAYGSRIVTAVLTLAASLWVATAEAAGGVATMIGLRRLDDGMWGSASSQTASGMVVEYGPGDAPIRLTAGIVSSSGGADFLEAGNSGSVDESFVGFKYQPGRGQFRPYLGAGAVRVKASFNRNPYGGSIFSDYSSGQPGGDEDTSSGYYIRAGAVVQIAKGFNIGLDLHRLAGTSLELLGTQTDANGLSASLSFGWSWGDWIRNY